MTISYCEPLHAWLIVQLVSDYSASQAVEVAASARIIIAVLWTVFPVAAAEIVDKKQKSSGLVLVGLLWLHFWIACSAVSKQKLDSGERLEMWLEIWLLSRRAKEIS